MKLEFSRQILKNTEISNIMKIRSVGADLYHSNRLVGGHTHMTKLIVDFRNFAVAPKNREPWRDARLYLRRMYSWFMSGGVGSLMLKWPQYSGECPFSEHRLVCKELNWGSCWQSSGSIRFGNKDCVLFIPSCTWRRQSSPKHTTDTASYTWREETSSTPMRTSNVAGFVYLVVEWVAVHTVGVVCLCSLVKGWHVAFRS